MRGVDFFPNPEDRDYARAFDREVSRERIRRADNNNNMTPLSDADYQAIFRSLNNQKRRHEEAREREQLEMFEGYNDLDLSALPDKSDPQLSPFKLKYDTIAEVQMRFRNTVILIKGHPFYVREIGQLKNDFMFLLTGNGDQNWKVNIADIPSLRGSRPMYSQYSGRPVFVSRSPARVNQQGMTNQNMTVSQLGGRGGLNFRVPDLVPMLSVRGSKQEFSPQIKQWLDRHAISELRLSDHVALFAPTTGENPTVEYKGRRFGTLIGDNVVKPDDEDDTIQPWIKEDFASIAMEVKP